MIVLVGKAWPLSVLGCRETPQQRTTYYGTTAGGRYFCFPARFAALLVEPCPTEISYGRSFDKFTYSRPIILQVAQEDPTDGDITSEPTYLDLSRFGRWQTLDGSRISRQRRSIQTRSWEVKPTRR